MSDLTFDDLLKGFKQTGIKPGDIVMVHSSYKSLGGVEGGADTVIDALLELVHPRGALFFPTYTIGSWCGGHYFDHRESPSEMGIIPEVARTRDGAHRTKHPIHSFAILGAWKYDFDFDNDESFEPEKSPYALFHRENGLIISIGVYWDDTISYVHYCEQMAGAAFRRQKKFAGMYVNGWGQAELKTYKMSVRKTLRHITHVAPLYDEILVPEGIVRMTKVGQADVASFRCQPYYERAAPLVEERPELFHYVKGFK